MSGKNPRKNRGVWLVGTTITAITGSKLPSNRQVLARFLHLHNDEKRNIKESSKITTAEIVQFWNKARIPVQELHHIRKKIEKLFLAWTNLRKNISKTSPFLKDKENQFTDILDDLFDIAAQGAMNQISIEEDKKFLLAQREKGRRGCMNTVDMTLFKKEESRRKRDIERESRKVKETSRHSQATESTIPAESDDSSNEMEAIESDDVEVEFLPKKARKSKRGKVSFITPELVSALDRSKISSRNSTFVLAAAADSLGHDSADLILNRESIRRARVRNREQIAKEIRSSFQPDVILMVHWDGKMLPALTNKQRVDRLAVVVSGDGVMKLLGVPSLENGTGEAQAAAVFALLQDWNLSDRVQLMSFDTTASNSGVRSGACVLLEKKLDRELLSCACRHHIFELIIAAVFNSTMGPSTGPDIKLFQKFASNWQQMDKTSYESGLSDPEIATALVPISEDIIQFAQDQLSNFQPREDYRELLILVLIFLGVDTTAGNIRAPGAFHRARWMAKLIYCVKIFIFRSQFHLTSGELSGLRKFLIFTFQVCKKIYLFMSTVYHIDFLFKYLIQIYLKVWYTAPSPVAAPRTDLNLLKDLLEYKVKNKTVGGAALKSFTGHLWYLSETLIALAFFDEIVSFETKCEMVLALYKNCASQYLRRIKLNESKIHECKLSDFVSSKTRTFFKTMSIDDSFLATPPNTWKENEGYIDGLRKIKNIRVVNDCAERGIALVSNFNGSVTNQQDQQEYLLQVVEQHRKVFPNANKSIVTRIVNKN